ncbi:hypothetical protein Fot_35118 [Forsythia ovata]|uniref:Uncharacterized protein n=1 Tax=Forsythia ovata TaxID=205694 RepID=A0ABD1SKX3_9LAMI
MTFLLLGEAMFAEQIQITLDKHVHWYVGLNKQGQPRLICVTYVSKDLALVNDKTNAVELGKLEREIETETLSFNNVQSQGNDYWQDLEILPKKDVRLQANDDSEVDENVDDYRDGMDINAVNQNVKSPDVNSKNTTSSYSSGPEVVENNQCTNEQLMTLSSPITTHVIPRDEDEPDGKVFKSKKILMLELHLLAMKNDFEFRAKKSNKQTYTIVSSRSKLPKIDAIYDALDDEHNELFLNSCFEKLYNVRSMQISPKLIHNLLIRRVRSGNADEIWFCLENEQAARCQTPIGPFKVE